MEFWVTGTLYWAETVLCLRVLNVRSTSTGAPLRDYPVPVTTGIRDVRGLLLGRSDGRPIQTSTKGRIVSTSAYY